MADQYSQDGEPLDIFGSDPFGRNYLYGLRGNGDGQGLAPYGTRYAENLSQPTTAKRGGYFGNIGTINNPMTEFSSAFEVGGRTVQYPLIVPTLTVDELQSVRAKNITPEIDRKAQQFALDRLSRGQDPFATTQELRYPQPQGLNPAPITGEIRETPRSFISGLFSDVLGGALNMPDLPKTGVPALDLFYASRKPIMNFMGVGDVQKTAERISYGEPLTSGAGGLGGTSRLLPETFGAAMTVAPFAPVAGRVGKTVGRMAGAEINAAMTGQPTRSLLGQLTPKPKLLDVYHGTPHTLPPTPRNPLGEFDASKIGTGEGNQAYGYGIYTAESPDVARTYQNTLSKYGELRFADGTVKNVQDLPYGSPEQIAGQIWINKPNLADAKFALSNLDSKYLGASKEDVLKQLESLDAGKAKLSGNFYKVDLPDEKIATMLDWDKPLSQQPKTIQNWLKDSMNPYRSQLAAKDVGGNEPTGSLIYNRLAELMSEGKKSDVFTNAANYGAKNASQELADAGIAGIKYLDEGSRATGQGTRNFVVFPNEEKSMTILERNGMPASQIQTPTYSDPFGNTIGSSIR